jgi:ribosomal protein L37AE/L43A
MSAGIDYGHGQTNIDRSTGIRYGCIGQHAVTQAWAESAEADYGPPTCPECGNSELKEYTLHGHVDQDTGEEYPQYNDRGCADWVCDDCGHTLDNDQVYGDEPVGWHVDDGEYVAIDCLASDILITKSPYYTKAKFCSPCVPGACSIESPDEDGEKAYCFGHDWFEDGVAPYPVYRVDNNELVPGKGQG